MGTQNVQLGPCLPCARRGRQATATKNVGGEPWCNDCFIDKPEEKRIETSIPKEPRPRKKPVPAGQSIIYKTMQQLRKGKLKVTIQAEDVPRVQSHLHEYARRWDLLIKTTSDAGFITVTRR